MTNSDSKTSKIKILKRSEPVPQSLLKLESGILKSKFQKNKTVVASWELKPKGTKPKVLVNQKQSNLQHKVQEVKSKTSSTNLKGPIKQWVPKSEIVNSVDMPKINCIVVNKDDNSIIFKGKRIENVYKINFSELVDQKVICLLSVNDMLEQKVFHKSPIEF